MDFSADFDRTSRYILAARLLRALVVPPGPILEVGGSGGFTRSLMPEYEVVVTDIAGDDVDLTCSGDAIPIPDQSFPAVVALDVLEHVPETMRRPILDEMGRLSTDVVLIAGPFDTSGVRDAEARIRKLYRAFSGNEHRWLTEHREMGLPDLAVVRQELEQAGFTVDSVSSNPLDVWERLQRLNFAVATVGEPASAGDMHRELVDRFLDHGDGTGIPYRHIVVARRNAPPMQLEAALSRGASDDGWDRTAAMEALDEALASVIHTSSSETKSERRRTAVLSERVAEAHADAVSQVQRMETATRDHEAATRSLEAANRSLEAVNRSLEERAARLQASSKAAAETAEVRARAIALGATLYEAQSEVDRQSAEWDRIGATFDRLESDLALFEASRRWRLGNRVVSLGRGSAVDAHGVVRIREILGEARSWEEREQLARQSLDHELAIINNQISEAGRGSVSAASIASAASRLAVIQERISRRAIDADAVNAWIAEIGGHARALMMSRRWRVGSALGAPLSLVRRGAEPALDRMVRVAEECESVELGSERPDSGAAAGRVWGVSRDQDREENDALYARYIRDIEPSVMADFAEPSAAEITFVVLANESGPRAIQHVLDIERTISAAAHVGPTLVVTDPATRLRPPAGDNIVSHPLMGDLASTLGGLLDEISSDHVMLLRPGDIPSPLLSAAVASAGPLGDDPFGAVVVDRDVVDRHGDRRAPEFLPGFSPDWLIEWDYVGSGAVFDSAKLRTLDLAQIDEAQPTRDLLLRMHDAGHTVGKIDAVLLHVTAPQTRSIAQAERDFAFARATIERRGTNAVVERTHLGPRLRYPLEPWPLVSIIIPFRDRPELLARAVESITRLTTYPKYEVLLVDNGSTEQETHELLGQITADARFTIVPFPEPFNYARANNLAASQASGEVLVFLNNDTQVLSEDWLERLAGRAIQPGVGAVGALLRYPNGSIQHAGVVVGMQGFAAHLFAGEHPAFVPQQWVRHARNTSAVTAACLAVSAETYDKLSGMDERFTLTGNDVDFGLRLLAAGYRNVFDPAVELIHFEKQSRSGQRVPRGDMLLSLERYEPYLSEGDPFYNANLSHATTRMVPRTQPEPGVAELRKVVLAPRDVPDTPEKGFLRRYDVDDAALQANRRLMEFQDAGSWDLELRSASWFVPHFDHVYRGGIYTIMRFADYLSRAEGTVNHIYLCGSDFGDPDLASDRIREAFPNMRFEVSLLTQETDESTLPDTDIAVCTLWTTAYTMLRFNNCRAKFYFVQDYEPAFQAANSIYGLAEESYRFRYVGLCNTPGVADAYRAYGNQAHAFRPAVDRSLFHPRPDRTDDVVRIVFYGRPRNERNGFALGVEALRVVKERYGDDVEIVSVGAEFDTADLGADGVLTNLGILPNIEAVAELYGRSDIGLVFMFTKHPSYQPLEYMASGCATVTNYNEANLWLLRDRENASLAAPTVSSVAEAIGALVENESLRRSVGEAGIATVSAWDWEDELAATVRFIKEGGSG